MMILPVYDDEYMGDRSPDRHDIVSRADDVVRRLLAMQKSDQVGILSLPFAKDQRKESARLADDLKKNFTDLVVIGIGGSDLGTRAVYNALGRDARRGMRLHFIGANTDPDEMAALLPILDFSKTVLNVISKSGDTVEPWTAFLLLREKLVSVVGESASCSQIVVTTSQMRGALRQFADEHGYRTLTVPDAIGGRFSVFTNVSFFPFACAGVSIEKFQHGAQVMHEHFFGSGSASSPAQFARAHYAGYLESRTISVLMPYRAALRDVGAWWRQLWAESLGKKLNRAGVEVYHGLTPVVAIGATDQHSQLQLYNEGPHDKIVTFLSAGGFAADFAVPAAETDCEIATLLAGQHMSDILEMERAATAKGLAHHGRPNGTLRIDTIDESSLGALMYFFVLATVMMAELLDIDAFNQPGVEEGKKILLDNLSQWQADHKKSKIL